ncbi:MAG: ABC transporter transmembrane domain-containing protein, partial [Lachnospiraceae bacterium]|nr:ABC transporter transmembrane domain-containing protein [Lachnospiraceae bacterium]
MKPTKRTTLTNPDTRLSHTLLAVVKNHRLLASAMLLLILCSILLSLLPPLVLERIVNQLTAAMPGNPMPVNPPSFQSQSIPPQSVQPQHLGSHLQGPQDIRFLLYPALLYFASLAVSGLFEAAQNAAITVFGQKTTHQLRSQMCEKLSRLPAAYFTANEPGKITSRFVSDVDAVDALFTNGIISMFADACKVISIILVIFWKSKGLGLLMVLLTPLLFLLTRVFQKRMLKAQLANRDAVGKVNNHIPETIRNIRMIHTLFRQDYMEKHYDDYIQESYRAVEKSNLYDSLYSPIIIFISSCVIALMMLLSAMGGGMQQFFGMSVGTAVAVTAYVGKVFTPLESIGMEIQNIQSAV